MKLHVASCSFDFVGSFRHSFCHSSLCIIASFAVDTLQSIVIVTKCSQQVPRLVLLNYIHHSHVQLVAFLQNINLCVIASLCCVNSGAAVAVILHMCFLSSWR